MPAYQPRGLGPVHQLHRAVMAQQQRRRQVTDGRGLPVRVPPDRDQQLVLGGRQADRLRLGLAPVQETPQPGPEREQVREVLGAQLVHRSRLPPQPPRRKFYRDTMYLVANQPGLSPPATRGEPR